MGGGDNFVLVENLAARLETRTDPLMVSPNVALRRGKTDAYMGFEYSGESRLFLSVEHQQQHRLESVYQSSADLRSDSLLPGSCAFSVELYGRKQ